MNRKQSTDKPYRDMAEPIAAETIREARGVFLNPQGNYLRRVREQAGLLVANSVEALLAATSSFGLPWEPFPDWDLETWRTSAERFAIAFGPHGVTLDREGAAQLRDKLNAFLDAQATTLATSEEP